MSNSRFATWMTWALFLGMIWTVVSRVQPESAQASLGSVAKEGFTAPDFKLKLLDGGTVTLSDLKGKVVLVEGFRGDSVTLMDGYRTAQVVSLFILIICILLFRNWEERSEHEPSLQ